MRVSVLINSNRPWDEVVRIAQTVDEAGAHAVYVPDHFMPNTEDDRIVDGPRLEAWTHPAGRALAAHLLLRALDERCAEIDRDPATVKRASGFFVDDISDGGATVAPWQGVCEEFVFGDVGHPADQLIDAVVTAIG